MKKHKVGQEEAIKMVGKFIDELDDIKYKMKAKQKSKEEIKQKLQTKFEEEFRKLCCDWIVTNQVWKGLYTTTTTKIYGKTKFNNKKNEVFTLWIWMGYKIWKEFCYLPKLFK